ncbi:MAG: serine/threonine-protein kinase [Streptosporangiaceae bacterium]
MDSLRPGDPRHIGKYVLSARLGAGGMGEVFFGRSPDGHAVAVKVIHSVLARDEVFRRRFRLEVELGHRVGGRHAAKVIDADPGADRPWMVTDYVAGPSLMQVLAAHPELPPPTVRFLGAGLADALCAIHAAGIIHRDLKPGNVLLTETGPWVIDFGIARAIDASSVTVRRGTPGFIAPEILTRDDVTSACDVFALGVVLAFAGGVRPFGSGTDEGIDYRVVHHEPELGGLDPLIREVVAECLVKEPSKRPQPAQIAERLGGGEAPGGWLPEPVHDMITAWAPPPGSAGDGAARLDHARLMAEAERIARALPDTEERSIVLLHLAAAVCRAGQARAGQARPDPAQAGRLLDDARYPADGAWRSSSAEFLIESSPAEVGAVAGCIDPVPADQLLADIAAYGHVLTHRRMGAEAETAEILATIAEAAAAVSPVRAGRIAGFVGDESLQAMAIARAAMVAAYTDLDQAEQLIAVIRSRIDQAEAAAGQRGQSRVRRWGKPQAGAAPGPAHADHDTARYWAALALAETAVAATGASPVHPGRRTADPGSFARTVTGIGHSREWTLGPGRPVAGLNPGRAAGFLAAAAKLADGIATSGVTASGAAAADLRAGALAAMKIAAARLDPAQAGARLAEAEQAARAIAAGQAGLEALGRVALTAARILPPRAEQIAWSLLDVPRTLGELALVVALDDAARAGRIAAAITDDYLRALVQAALAVRAAPETAGPLLDEAERAANGIPARLIEVAVVTAGTDPDRAERLARSVTVGAEIIYEPSDDGQHEPRPVSGRVRSAPYWQARALADLAAVADEGYESPAG